MFLGVYEVWLKAYTIGMENNIPQTQNLKKNESVHHVLAQSYFLFFVAVLVGIFLDVLFKVPVSSEHPPVTIGILFLMIGTLFIFWAQTTSRRGTKERQEAETISHEHFARGPYKYFKSPTHVGLTLLVLGYGLISNALCVILTTFIFALISNRVYIKKEEKILEARYGKSYTDYKNKVKL